jgi:hypothetical protein
MHSRLHGAKTGTPTGVRPHRLIIPESGSALSTPGGIPCPDCEPMTERVLTASPVCVPQRG